MNYPFRQDVVSAAKIMVVGCGALGNEVLKNLVLMGVRHIVVVDFDVVEADNLSRSVLFTMADVEEHRQKAVVVAERLRAMNPAMKVTAICGDIAYDVGLGLVRQMDVVIGCVDSRWARYCINRLCMRAGKPWIDGGIDGLEGTSRVFAPGKNCYACNLGPEGLRDLRRRMPCSGVIKRAVESGTAPTTSIVASVIGAVQVQEALKLLHSEGLAEGAYTSLCGKMFYYEGEHLTTRLAAFQAYDDDCAVHECWEPIAPSPLTVDNTVGEALAWAIETVGTHDVAISLGDDCFVDYVALRSDDTKVYVMKPGRDVATFIECHEQLRGIPFSGLYQHEYHMADTTFPYPELSLRQVGLPTQDVLHVFTPEKEFYFELIALDKS